MSSMRLRRALRTLPALAAGIIACGCNQGPTPPAVPTKLVFTVQPTNATAGVAIAPAVLVAMQDASGNTVNSATAAVTVALATNPGGATLLGTKTLTAVAGVASFADLAIDRPGGGYTLAASGSGLTAATSIPFGVTPTFATVSAGGHHTCGVTAAGAAYCWGDNSFAGQLGDGTRTSRSTPVLEAGGLSFAGVSAGGLFSCGVIAAGAAYCWGYNVFGQLGDGTTTNRSSPVLVAGGVSFAAVSAGDYISTCGVTAAGAAYCWGGNVTSPVLVAGGVSFAAVSTGYNHSCGVTATGAAYCWGYNVAGQLGDGSTTDRSSPVRVVGGATFATVSTGESHTCGVTAAGAAYCWGFNGDGDLGDGTYIDRSTPVRVVQ